MIDWLIDFTEDWLDNKLNNSSGTKLSALSFRYNNANNNVLVFQISNDLPLGQSVSFQYKATTVSNLLPSIFVSSPVYLSYVTLPPSLAPREGRKYEKNSDQVLCDAFYEHWTMMWHKEILESFVTGCRILSLSVFIFPWSLICHRGSWRRSSRCLSASWWISFWKQFNNVYSWV